MDYVWYVYHVNEDTSVEVYMGRISRNPWDLGSLFLLFAMLFLVGFLSKKEDSEREIILVRSFIWYNPINGERAH
jgi:hypothetical protein